MSRIIGTADPTSYPTPAVSLARMFYDRVEAMPDQEAFRFLADEAWQSVTWHQTKEAVQAIAAGLLALGIRPEDRVAIASATRYEWLLADLAIICAGAATTAVYPSTRSEDVLYILTDSGSRIVFAEDDTQLAKLHAQRDELPDVDVVVTFDGAARRRLGDEPGRPPGARCQAPGGRPHRRRRERRGDQPTSSRP